MEVIKPNGCQIVCIRIKISECILYVFRNGLFIFNCVQQCIRARLKLSCAQIGLISPLGNNDEHMNINNKPYSVMLDMCIYRICSTLSWMCVRIDIRIHLFIYAPAIHVSIFNERERNFKIKFAVQLFACCKTVDHYII